jgi:hypothetical protein
VEGGTLLRLAWWQRVQAIYHSLIGAIDRPGVCPLASRFVHPAFPHTCILSSAIDQTGCVTITHSSQIASHTERAPDTAHFTVPARRPAITLLVQWLRRQPTAGLMVTVRDEEHVSGQGPQSLIAWLAGDVE